MNQVILFNNNLIWLTVSRRVDKLLSSDHTRRVGLNYSGLEKERGLPACPGLGPNRRGQLVRPQQGVGRLVATHTWAPGGKVGLG